MRDDFKGWRPFKGWRLETSALLGAVFLYALPASAFGRSSDRNNHIFLDASGMPVVDNTLNGYNFGGGSADSNPASPLNNQGYETSFTGGIMLWSHLLVGATYDMSYIANKTGQTSAVPGQDLTYRSAEWGPTLGMVFGGFYVDGTYFISGSKKTGVVNTSSLNGSIINDQWFNNTGASGYLLAIGYSFQVIRHVYIGPKLAYRNITYSTQSMTDNITASNSYNATKLATRDQDSDIEPMLSLQLRF